MKQLTKGCILVLRVPLLSSALTYELTFMFLVPLVVLSFFYNPPMNSQGQVVVTWFSALVFDALLVGAGAIGGWLLYLAHSKVVRALKKLWLLRYGISVEAVASGTYETSKDIVIYETLEKWTRYYFSAIWKHPVTGKLHSFCEETWRPQSVQRKYPPGSPIVILLDPTDPEFYLITDLPGAIGV